MGNPRIEAMLADKFRNGFMHPGDPDKDIPATPILLPLKGSPGQPKEMVDLLDGTVKLISECIVHEIETTGDSEIVPRTEAKAMRRAVGDGPSGPTLMPISCRCSAEPLIILTVTDPDSVVVDGRTFLSSLARRSPACPHAFEPYSEADDLRRTIKSVIANLPKKDLTNKARTVLAKALAEFEGQS